MRVLQLTSSFPRRAGDVSGLFIGDLAATLAAAGIDVHVVAPHDAGAATDELLDGVHVHRFRYAPDRLEILAHRGGLLSAVRRPSRAPLVVPFLLSFLAAARRTVRGVRPDVVHAHWWFPGGMVGAATARLTGAPLVVTLHGSDVHVAGMPGMTWLARRVLRRAAVVGTVSEALRAEAVERLGVDPERCVLLPMPVRMPEASAPDVAPPPPLRLVAVGRLVPEKGYDVLLDALGALGREGVAAELDVFGDGPDGDTLRASARRLGASVRFHGSRSHDDIAQALARAHALVVPSRREGLGMVALEAMAVGRPVIASAVGGLLEIVEDGADGRLVPTGDPVALASALRALPLPPPLGAAVARHRPGAVAAAHAAAYEQALTGPRR